MLRRPDKVTLLIEAKRLSRGQETRDWAFI